MTMSPTDPRALSADDLDAAIRMKDLAIEEIGRRTDAWHKAWCATAGTDDGDERYEDIVQLLAAIGVRMLKIKHMENVLREALDERDRAVGQLRQIEHGRGATHCGHQFGMGARNHGGGCEEAFVPCDETYRCLDCGGVFHKGCLRRHFAQHSGETKESMRAENARLRAALEKWAAYHDTFVAAMIDDPVVPGAYNDAIRATRSALAPAADEKETRR